MKSVLTSSHYVMMHGTRPRKHRHVTDDVDVLLELALTRLWIFSDLHLTKADYAFGRNPVRVPEADVCVCAGDLGDDWSESIHWLSEHVRPHMPVVFVLGNHEYYGSRLPSARMAAMKLAVEKDTALLDDSVAVIGGVRFIGATLWTDFEIIQSVQKLPGMVSKFSDDQVKEHVQWICRRQLTDFRAINWYERLLTPDDVEELHHASRMFIELELTQPHDGPTVVVTHHAPHRGSLTERFAEMETSAAFVSDLSQLIEQGKPNLWVHGHTHTSFDYVVGDTRIICNPRGYDLGDRGIENKMFQPQLVIEV